MDITPLASGAQAGTAQTQPLPVQTPQSSSGAAASQQTGTAAQQSAATAATQTSQTAAASETEPSADQVKQAVQKINNSLASQSQQSSIEFSMDSTSHRIVVKVVDQATNQVISQIPSKQALAIADALDDSPSGQSSSTQGLFINQQA